MCVYEQKSGVCSTAALALNTIICILILEHDNKLSNINQEFQQVFKKNNLYL